MYILSLWPRHMLSDGFGATSASNLSYAAWASHCQIRSADCRKWWRWLWLKGARHFHIRSSLHYDGRVASWQEKGCRFKPAGRLWPFRVKLLFMPVGFACGRIGFLPGNENHAVGLIVHVQVWMAVCLHVWLTGDCSRMYSTSRPVSPWDWLLRPATQRRIICTDNEWMNRAFIWLPCHPHIMHCAFVAVCWR